MFLPNAYNSFLIIDNACPDLKVWIFAPFCRQKCYSHEIFLPVDRIFPFCLCIVTGNVGTLAYCTIPILFVE